MYSGEKFFWIVVILFVFLLLTKCLYEPKIDLRQFNRGHYGTR